MKKDVATKVIGYIKDNWTKAILFLIGIVITLIFGKACNKIIPDTPIVVKDVLDTIKIIHTYDFNLNNDSIIKEKLKIRLENIELAERYDEKIKRRLYKDNACMILYLGTLIHESLTLINYSNNISEIWEYSYKNRGLALNLLSHIQEIDSTTVLNEYFQAPKKNK